jgi:predicted MFS family arabinose efflux permease
MYPEIRKEVPPVSIFDPGFWPWFWTVILIGATATAALCLVAALVPRRHAGRQATGADSRDRAPQSVRHEHHEDRRLAAR